MTVVLLFISCVKEDKIDEAELIVCAEVNYDELYTMKLGDEICFPDGQSFKFKTLTPEFCPCFALCIWEGAFKLILETTDKNGDKDLVNLYATSTLTPQLLFEGYDIDSISAELNDPNVKECENEKIDIEKVSITMSVSAI